MVLTRQFLDKLETADLLEAAPDAWVIVDEAGIIRVTNSQAGPLFGYDDLVGKNVDALLPDSLQAAHSTLRASFSDFPHPRSMASGLDLHAQRADGSVVPVEISLSPIDVDGNLHVIAAIRDVTDALAVRRELASAREDAVVAEDRERLARDLHDTVIQELFAVGLGLQSVGGRMESEEAQKRVQQAIGDLDRVIRDVRAVIFDLSAAPGRRVDLQAEIGEVIDSERPALGFDPVVTVKGDPAAVSVDTAAHLIQTLREALSNVAKHAQAQSCVVDIDIGDEGVTLSVTDDGVGPPTSRQPGGRGLGNLSSRARLLGGSCTFGAAASSGSELRWQVPASQ